MNALHTPITTGVQQLTLALADKEGLRWAQEQVSAYHYLHKPVDVRSRPTAYHILLEGERVGCLIFGRPENTRVNGWYGGIADVASGKCRISRWEIINLARVWLHPSIQHNGTHYIKNAATYVVSQALRRVPADFLLCHPPVFPDEPYMLRECLSYCDTRIHQGALYRAANFKLMRTNDYGIETYMRPLRALTHAERAQILLRSQHDKRAQKMRLDRQYQQLAFSDDVEEVAK